VPFLLVGAISSGQICWGKARFVSSQTYGELTRIWQPKRGDVLYTAVGATYGVAVEVDFDHAFTFQRHIAHIRPAATLNPGFLTHFLNSPMGRRQADLAAVGNAQPTVTLKSLGRFIVPVPSLAEQREIELRLSSVGKRLDAEQAQHSALSSLKSAIMSDHLTGELRVTPDEASP